MTADDLTRVKAAHAQSLALSAAEREELLRLQFRDEPHLLIEVKRLLEWHDGAGEFLTTPLIERLVGPVSPEFETRRVGPYELIRELGRGGSATVYLARRADDLFEKQVAIKLLNRLSHSDEVFRRFRREIQTLARVEHPYIIRMLEAGTTGEALAYIVTEYVDGRPIDDYAAGLPLRDKLRLFLKVCEGAACAHGHSIVHRDLKPSNIVVTRDGTPKLLDFGIALNLERSSDLTETGLERMTLQYASPEQVRREKEITVASDIYSLGVILYELISGRSPYGGPSHESAQRILSQDPLPLPGVPRDLEAIVRKALRKEPAERYESAGQLRGDLARFLDGLPVSVRGDAPLYRFRRFLGRHRLPIGVCAAVLALAGAWVLQARAARQRSLQVKQLLTKAFSEAQLTPGGYTSLQQLRSVELARLSSIDALPPELREDADLLKQRYDGLRMLGYIEGLPSTINLGQTLAAEKSLELALELSPKLTAITGVSVAGLHIELGSILLEMDRGAEAAMHFQEAEALVASDPTAVATRAGLEILAQRSRILDLEGHRQEALQIRKDVVRRRRELYVQDPKGMSWEFAGSLCSYGQLLREMDLVDDAEKAYSEALPIIEADAQGNPKSLDLRWHLARENEEFAKVLLAVGRDSEAARRFDRAIELYRSIMSREPDAQSNQRALAMCLATRGQIGNRKDGRVMLDEALRLGREAAAYDPGSARAKREVAEIEAVAFRLKN